MTDTQVAATGITFAYPSVEPTTPVIGKMDLTLRQETVAILGKSGVGKSTLLRLLAGRLTPNEGAVHVPSARRPTSYMPQANYLLPWLNVRDNMLLAANLAAEPVSANDVFRAAEVLGLESVLNLRPSQISGGTARRTALGRALLRPHRTLFLDEPFSSIDAPLRRVLAKHLKESIASAAVVCVFVTHEIADALTLADRVLVLSGRPARVALDVRPPSRPTQDGGSGEKSTELDEFADAVWHAVES